MLLGKPVLPVLVSEGININLLSPPLNEIQITDYRRGDQEAIFALVKSIYTAPAAPPLLDPLPVPPRVPISYLSNLKDRIDSTAVLSPQDQITLLFELEEELRHSRSSPEIRDLLLRMKRRDDLLAKISTKIDAALKSLEEKPASPTREGTASGASAQAQAGQSKEAGEYRSATEPKFCLQCGTPSEAGQKFCGTCGTAFGNPIHVKINQPAAVSAEADTAPVIQGSKSRRYLCPPGESPRIISDVKAWLDALEFESQQINTENQNLLQVKKRGGWRDFVGMSTSLNLAFHQSGDTLTVQIGAGKWIDKAAAGTMSIVLLWPLAITAGIGAWEQMKMPEKIFDYIGTRLRYK